MAFDIRISGEHARVILSGDVDLQTTSDLKSEITKIAGVRHLEIDASSVTYIDSSGVAVLLMARQFCAQQNIQLSLPSISAAVHRVLEIAKLDQILPIGEVTSGSDLGLMGVGVGDNGSAAADNAVSDDELAAELLGDVPPASPEPAPAATPAAAPAADSASGNQGGGNDGGGNNSGGGGFTPGSFG